MTLVDPTLTAETRTLVCDLVEWVAIRPRTYADAMAAWRTSCPRLPIWEEATDLGLVVVERREGAGTVVTVTPAGLEFLRREARTPDA